ncbi:MAG: DinB family protein [Planctomycetales bacterium]|nr:DinB family protein [bacterium]UNM08614.1 MAG: DinB family protein [Planctomycetales bacterium]
MDSATKPTPTIGQIYPWLNMTFDYTDEIAALIPDELLDWRYEDPSGKWTFSLAEQAMHCADARIMFARQISGNDSEEGYWSPGPGEDGVWPFKEYGSKQAIMDSLKASRAELDEVMNRSADDVLAIPDGTRKVYEQVLKQMQEKGMDTSGLETRGPANIIRVLMAASAHEAGHRGSMQTLLRMKGINAGNE